MPIEVAVVSIARVDLPENIEIVGTIFAREESNVSAQVGGRVLEILADLGDEVDSGAVVARIDPTDYKLDVSQRESALHETLAKLGLDALPGGKFDISEVPTVARARVQAENARARLERAQSLFLRDPPLMSQQDFADIETQHKVAQRDAEVARLEADATLAAARSRAAELATSMENLAKTEIRAPSLIGARWSVASRNINVGETVTPGTITHRLIALDTMKFRAAVPERFVDRVKIGQRVTLRLAGKPDAIGRISRLSPAIDINTRTFEIEALFDNASRTLTAGGFARGEVEIGTRVGKIQIPRAALYRFAGVQRVFVIENGRASARAVHVIHETESTVVLEEDLPDGVKLAASNLNRLADGTPVQPLK